MNTAIEDAIHAWVVAGSGLAAGSVIWSMQAGPRPPAPYIAMRIANVTPIGHDWADVTETPLVVADDTFTAAISNVCTATAHGLVTGDGPIRLTTTGTLPAGLSLLTNYWIIRLSADTFSLASSLALAIAGTAVDITDTGSGVHTLSDTADTERLGSELLLSARGMREAVLTFQAFAGPATGTLSAEARLGGVLAALALPTRKEALASAGVGIGRLGSIQSLDAIISSVTFEPRATLEVRFFFTSEVTETGNYIESVEIENEDTGVITEVP